MAVYTEVSFDEASSLLSRLNLGQLDAMEGCAGGIENTNYFVTTDQGAYVLTLFERLTAVQLPFYLRLMKHLAQQGVPVPEPAMDSDGSLLYTVNGKPATVVNRLKGKSQLAPAPAHCAAVGGMLAKMHLSARDFPLVQPNLRGLPWWNDTVPVVLPFVTASQAALLQSELAYQNHVAESSTYAALPRGPIHADLFRDNVMFEAGDASAEPALTGFFDFYFAGVDTWVFDLAVCMNDWCIDLATGAPCHERTHSLLNAYNAVRPLGMAERQALPAMLRAGALRFWLSRLWDFHLPREASMLKAHDPAHFERVLRKRLASPGLTLLAPSATTAPLAPLAPLALHYS
jgi:homoserine kinase type II